MKRLMHRINGNDVVPINFDLDFIFNIEDSVYEGLRDVFDRLAAYEDAHEIYIKHTGDTVYYIGQGEIWDCIFCSIDFCEDGRITFSIIDSEGEQIVCEFSEWGKTVFLSEPEAQKALGGEVE